MAYEGSIVFEATVDSAGFEQGLESIKASAVSSMDAIAKVLEAVPISGGVIEGIGKSFGEQLSYVSTILNITSEDLANFRAHAGDIAGAVGGSGVAEAVGGLGAHFDTLISAAGKMNTLVKSAENIKTVFIYMPYLLQMYHKTNLRVVNY